MERHVNLKDSPTVLASLVANLRHSITTLLRRADRLVETVEQIEGQVERLHKFVERHPEIQENPEIRSAIDERVRGLLERAARHGIRNLEAQVTPDSTTLFRIDGTESIQLPDALANLLRVLAEDTVLLSDDGLVGWKSDESIRSALKRVEGCVVSQRALIERIYRLREAFEKVGLNRYLIQTDAIRGRRLALRRKNLCDQCRRTA